MKDLLLGAFTGYDYNQLQYWINSIKQTGFDGDIVVVVGEASFSTVEKLIQKGVKIIAFARDEQNHRFIYSPSYPIHDERFFCFYTFLNAHWQEYRYVMISDMKDVIFQKNPVLWLEKNLNNKIIVTSECITYENEPWGRQNLMDACGPLYEYFKDKCIYNVGFMAGHAEYMKDLCLAGYRRISLVEQANLNVMFHMKPWKDVIHFSPASEGFVANLGTTMDPTKIDQYRPFLLEPEPIILTNNGRAEVATSNETVFYVVHQYDRVPKLKEQWEKYYG